ncbi:hypothetical protein ETB97_001514 [Aspergillus alliaceus]|uniref:Heterokaryon incompatibility domain-containing protein n=1 Tax=Petromyces alliaceus TaxID=209559 RepID=A0A8H6EBM1_PETAA|nr:hypothetical protein ETB97_001514 [Aspergillus burnettii]
MELSFTVNKTGIDNWGHVVSFCLQSMNDARKHIDTNGSHSPNTWAASMLTASKWLSRCLDSHDKCRSSPLSGYTPTRLIQIGRPSVDKIRLLPHPNIEGTVLQYATLSHCWGTSKSSNFSMLTSSSLEDLLEGIGISELDQVFQDAVFTARSLGLHYLWIDSLCIFQDSTVDWEREAPLMSHVYGGAALNIAASIAAARDITCFPKRDPSLIEPCIIKSAWSGCENNVCNLYYNGFWDATFKDLPLMKRAWVIQELLLASRVLHLTGRQLFWECYELSACETYPGGSPPNIHQQSMTRDALWSVLDSARSSPDIMGIATTAQTVDTMRKLWKEIVKVYTTAQLTYTTDKLIALSRISKIMERALRDNPANRRELYPRPSPYRAPSWSWAGLDGRVSLSLVTDEQIQNVKPLIDILICKVHTATDDPFGAVTGGVLRLSGRLATIQLDPDSNNGWLVFFDGTWWSDRVGLFIRLDCALSTHQLHCLPLFLDNHQLPIWNVSCLLLEPTGDLKGQFRRVGALNAFSGALGMQSWTNFEDKKNEDWLEYEARDDDGRYVVSIL